MSDQPTNLVVINVVTAPYSGSTWLNQMLGAHSEAFSIGEIDHLGRGSGALCTLHGAACRIWSRFDLSAQENPYVQISRITGRRYLIVNNARRFLVAQDYSGIEKRFIFMVRDGRAVFASALRKRPQRSAWRVARSWKLSIRKKQKLIRRQDPERCITLFYEQIQAEREKRLKRLCDWIGINFEPAMLEYWRPQQHFIGGNPGAMSIVARTQKIRLMHYQPKGGEKTQIDVQHETPTVGEANFSADFDYYRHVDPSKFHDQRWNSELSDQQLRIFAFVAGRTNRRLGYPRSLERNTPPLGLVES